MLGLRSCLALLVALPFSFVHAASSRVTSAPVPPEMRSTAFSVTVDGQPVDVAHAAASYEYVAFDTTGAVTVEITAAEPGFWDSGVDIEPWRLGIRAERQGRTIRFKLAGPAKLSISRPRDFLASPAWTCTLARLRRDFDLILVDGGPLFTGLSAAVLHRSVDAAVLVHHRGMTGERAVLRAREVLEAGGIPLLGLAETFV